MNDEHVTRYEQTNGHDALPDAEDTAFHGKDIATTARGLLAGIRRTADQLQLSDEEAYALLRDETMVGEVERAIQYLPRRAKRKKS